MGTSPPRRSLAWRFATVRRESARAVPPTWSPVPSHSVRNFMRVRGRPCPRVPQSRRPATSCPSARSRPVSARRGPGVALWRRRARASIDRRPELGQRERLTSLRVRSMREPPGRGRQGLLPLHRAHVLAVILPVHVADPGPAQRAHGNQDDVAVRLARPRALEPRRPALLRRRVGVVKLVGAIRPQLEAGVVEVDEGMEDARAGPELRRRSGRLPCRFRRLGGRLGPLRGHGPRLHLRGRGRVR